MKFSIATIATILSCLSSTLAATNYVYVTQTKQVTKFQTLTIGGEETVAPVTTEAVEQPAEEEPTPSQSTWVFSTNILNQDIVFTSLIDTNNIEDIAVNLYNEHIIIQSGDSLTTQTLLVQANPTTLLTSTVGDSSAAASSISAIEPPIASSVATTLISSFVSQPEESPESTSIDAVAANEQVSTATPSTTQIKTSGSSSQVPPKPTSTKQSPPSPATSSTQVPATTSSSSSSPDFGNVQDAQFSKEILDAHNSKRSLHGVSSLQWDQKLYNFAQDYANKYSCNSGLVHSGGPYGENLAVGYKDASSTVDAWYDEIKLYNFNNPGFSSSTGHFTALVWKSTSKLGCAKKSCGSGIYVICSYDDAVPNMIGQFPQNVLPLVK
ncbi:uncharacterized protein KGF55_004839 [Candida pseudojiufengensis]|uniref:uncharacterized protein n=1 Tax=Candida pseudojiufengensis TaxID=497109 RepID=UPI0022258F20|nr:uncharacterized protein KGF55_004839 [Candida pseudojiufengensis]KAI5960116.1 hypothetical protein KGF55_004839 [Candida pseudojiufengensis]